MACPKYETILKQITLQAISRDEITKRFLAMLPQVILNKWMVNA